MGHCAAWESIWIGDGTVVIVMLCVAFVFCFEEFQNESLSLQVRI